MGKTAAGELIRVDRKRTYVEASKEDLVLSKSDEYGCIREATG